MMELVRFLLRAQALSGIRFKQRSRMFSVVVVVYIHVLDHTCLANHAVSQEKTNYNVRLIKKMGEVQNPQ